MSEELNNKILYDFLPLIKNVDLGNNLDDKLRLTLSIGLFVERIISLERASELSGKTLNEFIDILNTKKIAWNEYTAEHIKHDDEAIKNYIGKKSTDNE